MLNWLVSYFYKNIKWYRNKNKILALGVIIVPAELIIVGISQTRGYCDLRDVMGRVKVLMTWMEIDLTSYYFFHAMIT